MQNQTGIGKSKLSLELSHVMAFLVFMLVLQGCDKGDCNQIPDTRVMTTVSLVQYPELRIPQGAVSLNHGGISGLIVVNLGNNQFIAYDRCSPVDVAKRCAVILESNGLTALDTCSNARFILKNGGPASVSECPLKPYRATKQGETVVVTH